MINNTSLTKWDRLSSKSLDSQFINEMINGMNSTPFEAKAILETVHKVFGAYFEIANEMLPGKIKFVVLSVNNSPACKICDAEKITVTLTLDDDTQDLKIRESDGVIGLRRHRLQRICNETFMQGGLLTVEDIANRILCCGERTVVRDIKSFKDNGIMLPLRSTIKDMGRAISHRELIVEKWLQGKQYSEISRITNHSIDAINNYISKFKQVVSLYKENYDIITIAFLTKISSTLAQIYIDMWQSLDAVSFRREELETMLTKKK